MLELFVEKYGFLVANCILISVETIGLVKFFDNFIFPKRDLSLREKCFLEFFICIICAFANSTFTDEFLTGLFNLFALSLAITQLAYDCIVNGIPKFLEKAFIGRND